MALGWMDEVGERAGPLLAVARSFVARHAGGELAAGPEGVRRLTTLVLANVYGDDIDEDEDRAFVEGAGATLALLLLEHLREGRHRQRGEDHRLSLGRRGFFDPFAAIDAALDAEDPRAELARHVTLAEAEARGDGATARVVTAFEDALALSRPELILVDQFELSVSLGDGIEVDLAQVARSTEDQSERALRKALEKILAMLPGAEDGEVGLTEWEEAEGRLLPRLVPASFLAELHERNAGRGRLWSHPLGHDVHVALLVTYPGRSRYVREDELDCWGRSDEEVREAYLRRLAARSQQARFAAVDTPEGTMVVGRTGDGLDSARLLLPTLYDVLAAELEPPILAAVPHRDALLAASGNDDAMVAALRARAAEDAARAPHAITPRLFEVGRRGLRERR